MLKLLILLGLTTVIFMQSQPAYCGPRTMALIVSATLPEHVMDNGNLGSAPFSDNAIQLVQTQTVIRNNKSIILTSIVVP